MPRSFSCWNDKRRPGAKLFNDFSGIAAGAPGAGSSSLDPAASDPDEGGWSWSRSEQGLITEGLDVDELVASLTDDREVMEQFGVAQPPLSPPTAPSAPLGSPPALMPPLVADGITAWQPNGGAGAVVAMDTSMDVEAAVAEGAPEGAEQGAQPLVAATLIVAPEADPSGSGGAAGANGEAMAADPPQPSFEWTACSCPIRTDPSGAPLAAPVSASGAAGYGITVALQTPLLYWNERARWMWHKKWCLPRIFVGVSEPLDAGGSLGGTPLVAMVSCGTLRAGHEELHDQGLAGECTQRLNRTSGAQLEASFSSLLLQHTSFNCGNRPFHLFVTIAAHGPHGLQPLTCVSSPPIHVDARKRTKGERPEARAARRSSPRTRT
mmetsp:Transcript_30676/g.96792  ORF Transcript_30676/g.96792 Transcript_30676/m.96792 type:complete len:380 (-) Transcript_30676:33-1172(-)